ncbi:hypothetical protein GBF38_016959 [Nibea albiflora]|uniref:Uncharacterized protein n=1 Tax=Nibea albiflora TaxID=240163 RepID=A0ACB7EEF9_NIBAL|nr:hypothetical protein GBF38_016959 [Nibea albiflora]
MKLSVALFFAGLFGALAAVFILLSFGTDYWLLASESCHPNPDGSAALGGVTVERGDVVVQDSPSDITLYHEGFFWRCSFRGDVGDDNLLWKLWFTNQPHSKVCMHSYLFPFPVSHQTHNATQYDSAISLFLLCVVVMYVLWVQVLDVVDVYIDHQRSQVCPGFTLSLTYGLSFMFAPIGIFFCLLSGLLFLLIGRTIQVLYH